MAKQIEEFFTPDQLAWHKKYKLTKHDYWDCHNKPVPLHSTMQKVAQIEGITASKYEIIECDVAKGIVVVQVTCRMADREVSAIGEAHPRNNKNAYPTAMAQKRAYDRAITELTDSGMYTEADYTILDDGSVGFAPTSNFDEDEKKEQKEKSNAQRIAEAQVENENMEAENE
tara:strand:- start:396 stop:911 length:516 start_codon:yes stop_codon:yes gene_type:complete